MATIEMKPNDNGEWASSGQILPDQELNQDMDRVKRAAIRHILGYFGFDSVSVFLNYVEASNKYIREGILTKEEIDKVAKPYAIASLKGVLRNHGFDFFIERIENWRGIGVIDDADSKQLVTMKESREVALEEIKERIKRQWELRKHLGYGKFYPSVLDGYVLSGAISGEEVQELWEQLLK